jgi:hypothetical protein
MARKSPLFPHSRNFRLLPKVQGQKRLFMDMRYSSLAEAARPALGAGNEE